MNLFTQTVVRLGQRLARRVGHYAEGGLISIHDHEFLDNPDFQVAYQRALQSGQGVDPHHRWRRAHTALWVARSASLLDGDFAECGVNTGFISSAVMHYLDWNRLDKTFYLLDTFNGPVEDWFSETERAQGKVEQSLQARALGRYHSDLEASRRNFAEWNRIEIIQGTIPQTLDKIDSPCFAYLHIDMNQAYPEVKAAEFFWSRLVDGAFILLDDYAYSGYYPQKRAMDEFARGVGVSILSLPTGQGLMIRPPR